MELQLAYEKIVQLLKEMHDLKDTFNTFIESLIPPEKEEWLHKEDVMLIFKKSERTIFNWCQSGKLSYKKLGMTVYFLKSDVYKLL